MLNWIIGFRKLTLAAAFITVATILMIMGYINGDAWVTACRDTVVAFMSTNIGEHIIGVTKEWINNKPGKQDEA